MAVETVKHGHRVEELRSIEMHRLIAERLDDELRDRARHQLRRRDSQDAEAGHPVRSSSSAWRLLLDLPDDALATALVEDSQEMRDLRQDTPFAGVLAPQERWEIIRRTR